MVAETAPIADSGPLKAFLQHESVLALALNDSVNSSVDSGGPWVAPVLYVADDNLNLYFLSAPSTRHIAALPEDGRIAATIYRDYNGSWQSICGVQLQGHVTQVDEADREDIGARYFTRFPEVQALIDNPASEQEQRIGSAFAKSNFYRVTPSFIRFTNNADGFSSRTEWRF